MKILLSGGPGITESIDESLLTIDLEVKEKTSLSFIVPREVAENEILCAVHIIKNVRLIEKELKKQITKLRIKSAVYSKV